MAQSPYNQWFTEAFGDEGTAFGLAIKAKLHEEQSTYQHIEVFETETFGRLLVIDGCIMLTDRDNFLYHEMMAHPALFTHAHPANVVIIGGGDCGTLQEVLKHSQVQQAWQVEIDERVTRVCETYFPQLCRANGDDRAGFYFGDGVAWLKQQPADSIDIVIVDSTDPVGPAAGLFAVDFYRDCHRALRPGGLLVQQTESPLLHHDSIIRDAHRDMASAGFGNVSTLNFPQPVYPSGWWSATLAGKQTTTAEFDYTRAASKDFDTLYYNAEIHRAALAQPEFMKRAAP